MSDLKQITQYFLQSLSESLSLQEIENLRIKFLGKKGVVSGLMVDIKNMDLKDKRSFGAAINQLKVYIIDQLQSKKDQLELEEINKKLHGKKLDLTQPIRQEVQGSIHPISRVINEVKNIFGKMGFETIDGPEIEDDFHNFSALNIPEGHPARQMQDTFYLPDGKDGQKMLLRTHTSSVQIRKMLESKPPLKIISLGKVYRSDSDQTHTPMFHQIEALVIDKNINMGHLKWTIEKFLQEFFEIDNLKTRFRPSFFPFTEPSCELDIGYSRKDGCVRIGSDENFLEILGCGMIHPQILKNVNISDTEYQGFAFGIGIERLAMLKYGINDLRMFFEGDVRFLKHYH